jgi:Putative transcriptional regulator, homolog of Bvg accessory factor
MRSSGVPRPPAGRVHRPPIPDREGTVEAIQAGALYGHAGLVDGIMDRIVAALGEEPVRVATGGLASTIVPHCRSVEIVDEFLTLEGLRLIFERNEERT